MIPSEKFELKTELWKEEDREKALETFARYFYLNGNENIICYPRNTNCHIKAYKGYENCCALILDYGYADTEAVVEKYVKQYIDDPFNEYFIELALMPKDYEKYYKNGTYINADGFDTGEDFYDIYDGDFEPETQYENSWVSFTIFIIERNDNRD